MSLQKMIQSYCISWTVMLSVTMQVETEPEESLSFSEPAAGPLVSSRHRGHSLKLVSGFDYLS